MKENLIKKIVFDGYLYGIHFTYFQDIGKTIRNFTKCTGSYIPYTEHYEYSRYWCFLKQDIETYGEELIIELHMKSNMQFFESKETLEEKLNAAMSNIIATAFVARLHIDLYPLALNQGTLMTGDYHPGIIYLSKTMKGSWLPNMKGWKFMVSPNMVYNNLLSELGLTPKQIRLHENEYDFAENLSQTKTTPKIHVITDIKVATKKTDTDPSFYLATVKPRALSDFSNEEINRFLQNYELRDYQKTGVRHLISTTSALLADDMGLGKSRQAIVAASIILTQTKKNALIICPASLIINWEREILMTNKNAQISNTYDPDAKWTVINYEKMHTVFKKAHHYDIMIIDEAHSLKEPNTIRTKIAFDLAAKIKYRFILTGTPILNKESEIHTLLRLSGHPLGEYTQKSFKEFFAGSAEMREKLHQAIYNDWMLRRKKSMVLTELKGKKHQLLYLEADEKRFNEYKQIATDPNLLALPKITKLRICLENIKIDFITKTTEQMAPDDKMLIFCYLEDSVEKLKKSIEEKNNFRVATLTGSDSKTKRQRAVDDFQGDPETKVFVSTFAGAVGWTLTAANIVMFASLPFTQAMREQAEDRAFRLGQQRLVIIKIPLLENTIDDSIWNLLKFKKDMASDVLDHEKEERENIEKISKSLQT